MSKRVLSFLILSLPLVAFGQFNEAIGTYKDQVGRSVQRAKVDPGFIAAGEDGLTVFGGTEASIVKTKPSGAPVWAMVYGGIGDESFSSLREVYAFSSLPVKGYAALGTTTTFNSSEDLYFVRTDLSGTPLYSFTFGKREGDDRGHCLQYIKDFSTGKYGYIMVGQTDSYHYYGDSTDILIVKTDEDGALIRAKVMGNSANDIAHWVEQTKDGGFVVTGSTRLGANSDIFVVRLDKDLNLIWQSIYRHCDVYFADVGYGVVENPIDGSFTVTGFTNSFGLEHSQDAFLLNLKPNGAVNWMRTYGTKETEQGLSIDLSGGGREYVVSGFAIDGSGNKDAYVFKTDMVGNPIWSNLYGASSGAVEQGAEITNDGGSGYIFTGYAESSYTINRDYYLVNLSSDGSSGACEKEFTREWKSHNPCVFANFQDVDVYDLKFACTQYEKVDYQARACSGGDSLGALAEPSEGSTDALTVIPNPTSTTVQVLFHDVAIPKKGGTLIVSNRNGKIVYKTSIDSGDVRIPVETFPNDLYIVRFIGSDGKQYQKKFIKK